MPSPSPCSCRSNVPLPSPNLDDRTFDQLVAGAVARIKAEGNAWKDPAPGDPGMVLIDAFAYIAEQMLFRFNRIPEKAYVEFLNLIGATLYPPSAATVTLAFTLAAAGDGEDRHSARNARQRCRASPAAPRRSCSQPSTTRRSRRGKRSVNVVAIQADRTENEIIGTGTGEGSQTYYVAHVPIVGPSHTSFDVQIAVEMGDATVARPQRCARDRRRRVRDLARSRFVRRRRSASRRVRLRSRGGTDHVCPAASRERRAANWRRRRRLSAAFRQRVKSIRGELRNRAAVRRATSSREASTTLKDQVAGAALAGHQSGRRVRRPQR